MRSLEVSHLLSLGCRLDESPLWYAHEGSLYSVDILGMSGLLTTTIPAMPVVIQALEEAGVRDQVKIMVGGGAITAEFAETIGADGYDPTAPGAAKLARQLVGK